MLRAAIEKNILIRKLNPGEKLPMDLLLLADPSPEMISRYIRKSEIYVAELDHTIIAQYVLCAESTNTVEIKNIAVISHYQQQGLGKYLLADAAYRAREKNFDIITIGTADASIGQLYLYQKMGFEITCIRKGFFLKNYPEPIYENGIICRHMIVLSKRL